MARSQPPQAGTAGIGPRTAPGSADESGPSRLSTDRSSILATTPAEKLFPATAAAHSTSRASSDSWAVSASTSRPRLYGGELPRSAVRAHATGTPRAEAVAASSSASRIFPIPASPVHSTSRPRPARASSSRPVTRASSRSRPTITWAASPPTGPP